MNETMIRITFFSVLLLYTFQLSAQDYRPELLFREDWKETPFETPVHQGHVSNPDIIMTLHGEGQDSIRKSHHDKPLDDPYYLWSGLAVGTWAVSFKHKELDFDLTRYARVKWRTKQSGFRQLRLIIKLKDGTWLVSDQYDDASKDWRIREFNIDDINWYRLDISKMIETAKVPKDKLDLSCVTEIGCTDLMRGGRSLACSRLDWIELYAFPVSRK